MKHSDGHQDPSRAAILQRRALFVKAALSGMSAAAMATCVANSEPCLLCAEPGCGAHGGTTATGGEGGLAGGGGTGASGGQGGAVEGGGGAGGAIGGGGGSLGGGGAGGTGGS